MTPKSKLVLGLCLLGLPVAGAALAPPTGLAATAALLGSAALGAVLALGAGSAFAAAADAAQDEARRLRAGLDKSAAEVERFREISENIADWFWESDDDHRYTWISDEFETCFGLHPAQFLGMRRWEVADTLAATDSELWQAHMGDLAACRPFRDFKYWLRDVDGRPNWVKISGIPIFDDNGSFRGYRGIGTNITEAVATAHRMRMLNRAVEQSPVSIIITDLDGAIEYVNEQFLVVTGYAAEEVIGQNPRILKSGRTPSETFTAMWSALKAGEKWEGELVNRRRNGEIFWERMSIQPIQNVEGRVTNYLGIKTDITQQKQDEARMASLIDELHRSNQELEQFAYVASHDMRQPLRMISGYLGMLHKSLAQHLTDDTRTYFGFAIDGAKRLDRMIVDLLEYSRIGRLESAFEPVDLNLILANACHHLEVATEERKATLSVALGLPTIAGSRSELLRLFQNLIGNAIKYCDPDRPPVVEVRADEDDKEWVVSVKDNGIGIAKDDFQRVFGIFQRLVTRAQYEGTGIGLAVCRKIAEHHGGRIWLDSEPGQGSTFYVAFPKPAAAP